MATQQGIPASGALSGRRLENLALAFQEVLTAIVRLRANAFPVTDVEAFRAQIMAAVKTAEQDAAQRGYLPEDVRLVTFAAVAFLDESVLNSRNPVFVDWARRPLQEELFGVHVAGEIFFRNVERLLARKDSQELADVLEVHLLCILLGFRGRYSVGGAGDLRSVTQMMEEKIRRIRGYSPQLSPAWEPPQEAPRRAADPWLRRLLWGAVAICVVALLLFIAFKVSLASGTADIRSVAELIRL
jgi:type VI secretion system protein ImpK